MDRDKSLEMALGQIEKSFGKGSIMKMGEKASMDVEAISTGSLGLDIALGIGGLPRGRVVEIYGPESSGKTTLSLQVVAEAQKSGGICAFVDAELPGVDRVKRVFGVDEGADSALLLGFRHGVQGHRGLARAFRPVDLDDAAARQAADAERDVEAQGAGGDGLDLLRLLGRTQAHHRSLAELSLIHI